MAVRDISQTRYHNVTARAQGTLMARLREKLKGSTPRSIAHETLRYSGRIW